MNTAHAIRHELLRDVPACLDTIEDSPKVVAFNVGLTKRAIEQAKQGLHLLSLESAIAIGRHYPQMRELIIRYLDASIAANDEDPMRLLHEVNQQVSRLLHMQKRANKSTEL